MTNDSTVLPVGYSSVKEPTTAYEISERASNHSYVADFASSPSSNYRSLDVVAASRVAAKAAEVITCSDGVVDTYVAHTPGHIERCVQAGEGDTRAISEKAFLSWIEEGEWRTMRRAALREKLLSFNYENDTATDEVVNTASHLVGTFLTLLGGAWLIVDSAYTYGSAIKVISFSIYTLMMFMMFLGSTLHHGLGCGWGGSWVVYRILRLLDHLAIFLMISGVFTPMCLVVAAGPLGYTVLSFVWLVGIIGIVLKSFFQFTMPQWVFNVMYLAMGWAALFLIKTIKDRVGAWPLLWLLAGGVAYTVGIVFFIFEVSFVPNKFGSHEVFHLLIIIAAACHYYLMYRYVLPYE